jgi:hypothetical protein
MKKAIRCLIGLGAVLLVAGPLFAQTRIEVKAHVPFAFMAGKEDLPAGDYTFVLDYENTPMVVAIQSKDGRSRDVMLAETVGEARVAKESKLVFEKIGDQDYLSQVQVTGFDTKDVVPQTEIMKEYVKNAENKMNRKQTTVPLRKG